MVALVLTFLGILCILSGVYGAKYPQKLYQYRQIGQTSDNPQLNETGKIMWRIISVGLVMMGIFVVGYSFTV